MGDDLLACVLGGVYTDVEKTMIELQRTIVQETRSALGAIRIASRCSSTVIENATGTLDHALPSVSAAGS